MCSQQSKGAKYPQKSFNCADTFSLKITRFHAALKPIFRSLKPFQAFSSLLNLGARDFSFYMNTHRGLLNALSVSLVWQCLWDVPPMIPSVSNTFMQNMGKITKCRRKRPSSRRSSFIWTSSTSSCISCACWAAAAATDF